MARRYYSSTAARTTLASGVDNTTTTLSVTAVSGWPASYPYTLVIDQDTVNEELVSVTNRSGTTLTVVRGIDGTSAVAHDAGAAVNHGVSAQDFDEPNAFINGTGTVTETLLATGSVTEAKLATNSVSATKIVDGTITNAKIGASADIAQSKIANLTSDLASKLPYSYGTATPTTTDSGFLWYDSNSTPPEVKFWDGSAFQALTSGKILQIVRATDATDRSTTSGSAVDTNVNVTITPTKSTSAIFLIANLRAQPTNTADNNKAGKLLITDNSNNPISGCEEMWIGAYNGSGVSNSNTAIFHSVNLIAYATPATTSAVTYKIRFMVDSGNTTFTLLNSANTAQFYAIEVGA